MFNDPFANQGMTPQDPNSTASPASEEWSFDMPDSATLIVPEGVYVAKVSNVTEGTTRTSGDKKLVFEFMITEASDVGQIGELLAVHVALTDKAMWKLQQILYAVGAIPTPTHPKLAFRKAEVINTLTQISVKHGEFQGRPTANIDQVLPYPGGVGKKWTPAGVMLPTPNMPAGVDFSKLVGNSPSSPISEGDDVSDGANTTETEDPVGSTLIPPTDGVVLGQDEFTQGDENGNPVDPDMHGSEMFPDLTGVQLEIPTKGGKKKKTPATTSM